MSNTISFKPFSQAVETQFALMQASGNVLVVVDIEPTVLWSVYLESFPEGTNPIFRERTEYDCNCCKNFIRDIGNVVSIGNTGIQTIWDVEVPGYFQQVTDTLADLVRQGKFKSYYIPTETRVGQKTSKDSVNNITWNHFYATNTQSSIVKNLDKGSFLSELHSTRDVFKRGLETLSLDASETVLELINQGSLYRGNEHKTQVENFISLKKEFDKLSTPLEKEIFIWSTAKKKRSTVRFRSSVIGTLVEDISQGKDLEQAVKSFENKVAPSNYRRTTAIISKGMIEQAQKTIKDLGLEDSLIRRYATPTDLTVNNILFSSTIKPTLNVFEDLIVSSQKTAPKQLSKIEEISIDKFISDVLPSAEKLEVLFSNKHVNNLVSLVAPAHPENKNLFKWGNPFSWSYTGDITDSIQERVKAAGGTIKAPLRVSLAWFNYDDLDLSVVEPDGNIIYYGNRYSFSKYSGGKLDVDMNAGHGTSRESVENIIFPNKAKIQDGTYKVRVHNFARRESSNVGFDIQIEADGSIHNFSYKKAVKHNIYVTVCHILVKNGTFEITNLEKDIKNSISSKEVWGINTETFVPVSMVMNSPNFWDNQTVGNKHTFFILENCTNPDKVRGFYNEFLSDDLIKHRKVFEVLGDKLKTESSKDQVSGIGFSETIRNSLTVRVTGKTQRTFIIKF